MASKQWDDKNMAQQLDEIADEILAVSAALNGCGEAISCRECSSKLISVASRYRAAAGKLNETAGGKKEKRSL